MITAKEAREKSDMFVRRAPHDTTEKCIQSIECSIHKWAELGQYKAPVDMYTQDAIVYFSKLGYNFRSEDVRGFVNLWCEW